MKHEAGELDSIFEALANKHRRAILYRLSLQPVSISDLADEQKLSLPAMHKHLKVLERAGLVLRKKSGRCNFLALRRKGLINFKKWSDQFRPEWGSDEASLENYVAEIEKKSKKRK